MIIKGEYILIENNISYYHHSRTRMRHTLSNEELNRNTVENARSIVEKDMRNSKEGKIESTGDTFRLPDIIHYRDDVIINID